MRYAAVRARTYTNTVHKPEATVDPRAHTPLLPRTSVVRIDYATMAAVRQRLTDASDKLRTAFSGLNAIGDELEALTVGGGGLPLSEAAARVSQGARTATAIASTVLKAAKAAEAAAGDATAAVISA